ncbi:DNA polymerase I [hydrothermal vent metagenome]|uniref:DNA-directed DNA polymerase n=1 Tax=hydrothermal vent metagenome TaxID=652676 RepID=A0A3B1BYB5_9ZZZZ
MPNKKPSLFLIDGAGYYFRAYFAIRHALTNAKGVPTNAVYGFVTMLKKILDDKKPDYVVMTLDSKGKTFRHEMYDQYKANRPQMPEDLAVQLPYIDKVIEGFNMHIAREPGWEADDIIAAAVERGLKEGFDITIVTSDKDLMQLIRPGVAIYDSMKDKNIGPKEVAEKFGVTPDKVADVLGLMGDSSDNIPGVPGVGEKTAQALMKEYGDMESVLAAANGMKKKKLRENLIEFADQARLSKKLATVASDAPIHFDKDSWKTEEPDYAKLRKLYTELGFSTLLKDLKPEKSKIPRNYISVLTEKALSNMLAKLEKSGRFAVDTETTSQYPMQAILVGMSFSCSEGEAYYVPFRHDYDGAPEQVSLDLALPKIKKLLSNEKVEKYGQNIKYDMIVLAREGVEINPVSFDTMIASYLLNPSERHGLSALAMQRLGETTIEFSDVCGKGAKQITFNKVEVEKAVEYAAEDADMTLRLVNVLRPLIEKENASSLMDDMELPLVFVLAEMEKNGVLVDESALCELSALIGDELGRLEKKIYEDAECEFNINSPKQLGEVLFDKLKLPTSKKTKTGYSTGQDVLETLAGSHPLPTSVLEYRKLTKLKSGYADALPKMINQQTGRIHTSFNQTITATGRLSSSDPNLQNIPVRTELGRKIRKSFIAPEGRRIVSADYSQIELRLLAHYSKDKTLIAAFQNDEDIHASTAAEIFNVAPQFVTSDMRRVAKTVNFGVIYGQTAFGLAKELSISRGEAQRYIDGYFARYPGIREYIDETIRQARNNGFVLTLFGRKRYLPDINAKNKQVKKFAERNAVNTPMQGSAADLIKKAMISIYKRLKMEKFEAKMTLQVHDELVFESPESETKSLKKMVKYEMENVHELLVPLVVSIQEGANWDEAH